MSSVISDAENKLLEDAASNFGETKNFGRDPALNGMDSFTLSVTFELDTLKGGTQALLWNTQQYGLLVHNNSLYVYLRGANGYMDVIALRGTLDETGWHDVQIVLDDKTNALNIWVDGENVHSGSGAGVDLGGQVYSDITAGMTPWGHTLKGQIADVSISNEAKDVDGSQSIAERMQAMDEGDLANVLPEQPNDYVNTAADISGDAAGGVREDVQGSVTGKLTAVDVDAGESGFQAETIQGAYGTLVIDASGEWTYSISDGSAVQALKSNESVSDVIRVKSIDGTEQEIVITVQGTDDAPVITGTDSGSVTEDASLMATGKLTATDKDAGQSGFIAESISGAHGTLNIDLNGSWTFVAMNSAAFQALGAGDSMNETFTVRTVDGTEQRINITLEGTDDVPVITGDNSGSVTEDASLTTSGKLDVSDKDGGESGFQAESLEGAHGTLTIDQAGSWTYVAADSPEIQALNSGDTLEEVFTVKTADGTPHEIRVIVDGVDETTPPVEPVSEEEALDNIAEEFGGPRNLGRGSEINGMDSFTLSVTFELDTLGGGTQSLLWNTQQYGLILHNNHLYVYLRGSDGYMDVTSVGQAFDKTGWHDVQIVVDDASNGLNIYVDGDLVRSSSAAVVDLGGPLYSDVSVGQTPWGHQLKGQIADVSILNEARDVDPDQSVYERMYAMDQGDNAVSLPETQTDPDPVNNVAAVSGKSAGTVAEDNHLVASGKLIAEDADAGESGFQAATLQGSHGKLAIDSNGNWTYTGSDSPAVQALGEGDTLVETFTVRTIDGTEQTITVTIEGRDDAPVISGNFSGTVAEDSSLVASGKLTAQDADAGESGFKAVSLQGLHGALVIDAAGNWTYTGSDSPAIQALDEGDQLTEIFTVQTADGTEQTVTVTIEGNEDAAVITGTDSGSVTEDQDLTASGKLHASDADKNESGFQADAQQGDYGDFSINNSGNWTYTASADKVDALNTGDNRTETFTVKSIDGTEHTVSVNVAGADENTGGGGNTGEPGGGEVLSVSSVVELKALLDQGVSGVTIALQPGDYNNFYLSANPDSEVRIVSADPENPARVTGMAVNNSSNLSFEGIDFNVTSSAEVDMNWGRYIVRIENSNNINIENSEFSGLNNDIRDGGMIGLYTRNVTNLDVEGNEFHTLTRGALYDRSDDITVVNNDVSNIRSDGFDFTAVQGVHIEGNQFKNFYPAPGDHGDYIQFWSTGTDRMTKDVVIRNNFMPQGVGDSVQAIFVRDESGAGYQNFLIENNLIYQSGYHGISVGGIDGLIIRNNTVLSNVGIDRNTWIGVNDSQNVVVEHNLASTFLYDGGNDYVKTGNIVATPDGTHGQDYELLFGAPLTQYSDSIQDFLTQNPVDAGADLLAIIHAGEKFAGDLGDNNIVGDEAANTMFGFSGNDTINGGGGDDTIRGGLGRDELTGGEGADTFVFDRTIDSNADAYGRDVITDFSAEDKISFAGLVKNDFSFIGSSKFAYENYDAAGQIQALEKAAQKLGSGEIDLGRDPSLFGMEDFTLSVAFELNSLDGGYQGLIWNHMQYGILVNNDGLRIALRNEGGGLVYKDIPGVISQTGWHDIQVTYDGGSGGLNVYMDGSLIHTETDTSISLSGPEYWNVTAGSKLGGSLLNGQIADVSVLDQVVAPDAEDTLYDRTIAFDDLDLAMKFDRSTGNTQVRYDEESGLLQADFNGDLEVDLEIELVGVNLADLSNDSFTF